MVRDTARLSREDFADELAVTPATIGRYEKGERTPDAGFLHQLVIKFGCDPEWLLIGGGSMRREEPHPADKRIDEDLLEAVIEVVEEILETNDRKATPKQKTQLILALYDLACEREDHSVDRPTALRLVKLMAA